MTTTINVSIHYKYRYDAGDPWWDSDESDSGRLGGWFSVKDGKLSVKFSESDPEYY